MVSAVIFGRQVGWVRIGKLLIQWKHRENRPMLSEREGHVKFIRIRCTPYRVHIGWEN